MWLCCYRVPCNGSRFLVIVLGLFAVQNLVSTNSLRQYGLFFGQRSITSASAKWADTPYSPESADHLMVLAKPSLPADLDLSRVGLILEMRFSSGNETQIITQRSGNDCQGEKQIESLASLAPKSQRMIASLQGKTADLYQVTLCVSKPLESVNSIFEWLDLPLATKLQSQAAVIGRKYSA